MRHHEQKRHAQNAFAQDVRSLNRAVEEMGNSFTEDSNNLLDRNRKDVMDTAVVDRAADKVRLNQYKTS